MRKVASLTALVCLLSTSPAIFAEDATPAASDHDVLPKVALLAAAMLADLDYDARPQPFYPAQGIALGNDGLRRRIAEVDFTDNSTIGRLSKLRGVSLLTVAAVGESRLYLGVNDDGVVGLHFNAFMRSDDKRHLELLRMPYLAAEKTDR